MANIGPHWKVVAQECHVGWGLRGTSFPDIFAHHCWTQVHSIVSKMMMEEQLSGRWDQPTRTIVMHSTRATRVQSLALTLAEKTANLVDLNERALTLRTGGLRDEGADEGRGYEQPGFSGQRRCLLILRAFACLVLVRFLQARRPL